MRKLFFIIVTAIGMMQIPMQSINAQNMKKYFVFRSVEQPKTTRNTQA